MSPSKTFNLPGLNFAFAIIAAPELRRRFTAAARGLLPNPGCFAIAAAEAAYREGDRWLTEGDQPPLTLIHRGCGKAVTPVVAFATDDRSSAG